MPWQVIPEVRRNPKQSSLDVLVMSRLRLGMGFGHLEKRLAMTNLLKQNSRSVYRQSAPMAFDLNNTMKNNKLKLSILVGGLLTVAFSLTAFSQCRSGFGYDEGISYRYGWGGGCDFADSCEVLYRGSNCGEPAFYSDWSMPVNHFTQAASDFDCGPDECAARSCGEGDCSKSTGLSWASLEMLVRELVSRLGFYFEGMAERVDDSNPFYYSERSSNGPCETGS